MSFLYDPQKKARNSKLLCSCAEHVMSRHVKTSIFSISTLENNETQPSNTTFAAGIDFGWPTYLVFSRGSLDVMKQSPVLFLDRPHQYSYWLIRKVLFCVRQYYLYVYIYIYI
jgi:hypothetical protein